MSLVRLEFYLKPESIHLTPLSFFVTGVSEELIVSLNVKLKKKFLWEVGGIL
tara:strand:+ start:877 stop:1032 length:156 start_codon:yes stop_codon:yes gene_type:complete